MGYGLAKHKWQIRWPVMLVGLLTAVSVIQLGNPFFRGTRLKPIEEIVRRDRSVAVAHTSVLTYYSLDYYSKGAQKQVLITKNPLSPETLDYIGGQASNVGGEVDKMWLVDVEKWAGEDYRKKLGQLFEKFEAVEKYQVGEARVWLLERK